MNDARENRTSRVCPPKTRSALEWDRVLSALESRCTSALGAALARALPFAETIEEARRWAAEGREALALHDRNVGLPGVGGGSATAALHRVETGGLLGAPELLVMVELLRAARSVRHFLDLHREECPCLASACQTSQTLDAVADRIAACIDADGSVSDKASDRLRSLRIELRGVRGKIHGKLEQFMSRHAHFVQDRYVTERDGHWVIPLRATALRSVPGRVHGESASGSTVYFEPEAVGPLTQEQRRVERDIAREEAAIFTQLSALLCGHADRVLDAARAVAIADVRRATARLASDLRLTFPELSEESGLVVKRLRHVLLVIDLPEVVGSDVSLHAGEALIVSGPNAGGKTAIMKALGLAALMTRAGLPIASDVGSRVGLFDDVLAEIGDDQSLSKNLSTFSAHMVNVAAVLRAAGPRSLVLLDEVASGTDPREGDALAAAIVLSLCSRGVTVVVTTHYEQLKTLPAKDDRCRNASVGFDFERMLPTFRLALGIPGGSCAFAVAQRFGVPEDVLTRARGLLGTEAVRVERTLEMLEDHRRAFEARLTELDQRAAALAEAERAMRARLDAMPSTPPTGEPVDAVGASKPAFTVEKGAHVYVASLKRECEVLHVRADGVVRVASGSLKVLVKLKDVFPSAEAAAAGR